MTCQHPPVQSLVDRIAELEAEVAELRLRAVAETLESRVGEHVITAAMGGFGIDPEPA